MVNKRADKEQLSALMDGELVDQALISELTQDGESQLAWRHYHLIGDVMRGEETPAQWNIADQVALALENEAPHSRFDKPLAFDEANVVPIESQPTPEKARRRLPAWLAQLGQVSIAASVCLAIVFGISQQPSEDANVAPVANIPVLQTVPLAGVAEPVSLTRSSLEKHASETELQEQRLRINALLQDYELQLRLNGENISEPKQSNELVVE